MDISFLKLFKNNFNEAVNAENTPDSYNAFSGFVNILPTENIIQVTNCDEDIAFAGNFKVELIDLCRKVIKNITDKFYFNEFTDLNGIKQIEFEIVPLQEDFYSELLFIKITHTTSDNVWYSKGFTITDFEKNESSLFHYRNESFFEGVDYEKTILFQSVRVKCFKTEIDTEIEVSEYTQLSGNKISLRPTFSDIKKYIMYDCDNFTYARLLRLLNHDLVYIDGVKISNKAKIEKQEKEENSNIFEVTFEVNQTNEKAVFLYGIANQFPFATTTLIPTGQIAIADYNNLIIANFNKGIVPGVGTFKVYDIDNNLIRSFAENEIDFFSNYFEVPNDGFNVGTYYIKFSKGLVKSIFNEDIEIINTTDWTFQIVNPDYSDSDYSNNDYLI